MKIIAAISLAFTTMTATMLTAYADVQTSTPEQGTVQMVQQPLQNQRSWLGVLLAPVPEVLSAQLSDVIPDKQGVMVQSVTAGSPTAKAGIQPFDILLRYGNQQLYSAQQLAGLVASDKANTEVTLTLIRNGKKQDIKVTLEALKSAVSPSSSLNRHPDFRFSRPFGSQARPNTRPQTMPHGIPNFWSHPFSMQPMLPIQPVPIIPVPHFNQPLMPPNTVEPSMQTHVMQQFESIQVRRLDGDRYSAEVEYQENAGEKKKFTFEGTYNEVYEQIKNNRELPLSKKNSLLNVLKSNPGSFIPGSSMNFPAMPSFGNPFSNTPSWY